MTKTKAAALAARRMSSGHFVGTEDGLRIVWIACPVCEGRVQAAHLPTVTPTTALRPVLIEHIREHP